ncbi:complement factor H-like [Watersipora subatra]|uniref:complement factor H-like n=1 Tax=Watersipora subatra TaxID=2589382 RepID=UPI00355B2A8E
MPVSSRTETPLEIHERLNWVKEVERAELPESARVLCVTETEYVCSPAPKQPSLEKQQIKLAKLRTEKEPKKEVIHTEHYVSSSTWEQVEESSSVPLAYVELLLACAGIRCGNPPQIQNGVRRVYGHYLNDRTKYRCHTGYLMVGDEFIYCETNGHWTVSPECDVITCEMPPTPDNAGLVSMTGTQFGQTVTYQCLPGYTTDDPTYITCQLNGEWSRAPNCTLSSIVEEIDCDVAPQVENGNVLLATGTEAKYTCISGYKMTGESVIECQSNQEWSTLPQCHKVNCGPPPVVDNSKRQVSGQSYNDTVRYECDVGYEMTGDDTVLCQETGYWTVHPDCEEVACGVPPTLDNAGLVFMTGTQYGQTATYQCLPGYTTDDPTYIICQSNGEWSRLLNCTQSLLKVKGFIF